MPETNSFSIYLRQKNNPLDVITFMEVSKNLERLEIKEQTTDMDFQKENANILYRRYIFL
jgi:hypothetical protein